MIELEQKSFKEIQAEYDGLFKTVPIRDEDRGYRWIAGQLLRVQPQLRRHLDLACGGGYFLRELHAMTKGKASLAGLDISSEALRLAKGSCPTAEYFLGVAESLPFAPNSFDSITCLGSLEHFLAIPAALQELKRVARQDAVFLILVPNLYWYKDIISVLGTGDRKTRNQSHERFAPYQEWKEMLEGQGFKILETLKYNGIARQAWKQYLKDLCIPFNFSYHFLFICRKQPYGKS